ncbi:DUF637 domain-containing protein, partial [Photorhabdus viridis]|uniref:DUF637 domain-containing protein n=1 Tax=Photorhabdus viridis TaxID=3163327 RepID=UPI00330771AF
WVLPAIHLGGKLTVEAANGVSADIKAQNGQSLQNVVSVLGNTPETAWLKGFNERQDVQWNLVKDAYDRWDYKSQHLNPVVSAVIAIAVAAATVGSMAYGATASGMAALTSQAAVALVDNQGDLSKALKAMGSSDTVKSTFTSMVMGGALAGFDTVMGWDNAVNGGKLDPAKATLPQLSNHDWSKVAQRVAGQSIIGASLGTTINGGSFKDNFTTALLVNIGNQINAEGAHLIGDNGEILGYTGKMLSHAVVAGISAEIAGGNAKGAAVGALAAELAAITMESRLFEPAYKNEAERQIHQLREALTGNEAKAQTAKFIGALSGALISHTPEGAYSAANSAELVYRNNMTEHMLHQLSVDNQKDILAAEKGDKSAAERVIARRDAAITVTAVAAGGYALTYGGQILIAGSAEMATAGRVALKGCKTNPALCLNNVGIFVADAIAPEAAVGTGVLATGTVKVLGNTQEGVKNLAEELSHVSKPLLSNAKPDTHAVTRLIENEKLYAGKGTSLPSKDKLTGSTANWKNYTHAEAVIEVKNSGKLVNANNAVIDSNKVTSYALNTEHPVGGNKAKVFESALGYNQSNATDLISKIQAGTKTNTAILGNVDKFGQRITIDMPITGPNGKTAIVRTGWIYDTGSSTPRLTTLYVK